MKKVKMILTNRFDPDVRVHKEAKYLVSKGYDVEILCWDREGEYRSREIEIVDGIKIKRFFPYAKYGTGFKQLKAFYNFIIECKQYLINKEYDYLHCHDLNGIIAGYMSRKNKSNLVFDMHEFYEVNGKRQKYRYLVRVLVNFLQTKSTNIIYVNEMQTIPMIARNKDKLVYLPNYPEASSFVGCEKYNSDKLRIAYIGAVRQYIELKRLMDACKDISGVEISIHGAGVAFEGLSDIENNYKNVKVTGKYDFRDSPKLYSEADLIYALYPIDNLQNKISYPIKLFESIITKTPIIVSKDTVLEDFIMKYDIGFVVDGTSIEDINELIIYINENRQLLNEKTRNLEKIQFDYSWDEVVKNLDEIYY